MHRNTLCGVILLAVFFPQFCSALVCYDNVVAEEPVLIGCNFRGAACGVTNKTTTTTSIYGFNITDHKVLYHCAGRSTSCAAGPLNHCYDQSESQHVSCLTSCCESDKCNLPADTEFKVKPIPENKALSCYQLIGDEENRVKCLFEGAVCLYLDIGPPDYLTSYGKTQKRSGSQLCTTKKFCDAMKTGCDASNGYQNEWDISTDRCTTTCCTTDYCNPLPYNTHYQDHGQHPNAKAVKPTHTRGIGHKYDNKNPKTEAPWEKDTYDDSVNVPADNNYYDDSVYSYTDNNGLWTGLSVALAVILTIVGVVIRYNCRRRATVKYVTMRNT